MLRKEEYETISKLSEAEASALCQQLRLRLLEVVSQTGGHLASNLGVVELTVALHRVFDTGRDRLIFDVGHQCYIHKILTGRNALMESIRSFGGLAGFPKPSESPHDAFIAGHASNAASLALGMAKARSLMGQDHQIIALLGDGALTGGLAYEGLSAAGQSGEPMLVILNDNGMSIDRNVGAMSKILARYRLKPHYFKLKKVYRRVMKATKLGQGIYNLTHKIKAAIKAALLPGSLFEDMGFQYMGPVDGHDLKELTELLRQAKKAEGPVLLHVWTVKGKGYAPAECSPDNFHGTAPFALDDGSLLSEPRNKSYSECFGEALLELAREEARICAITAAMQSGTGLSAFAAALPERCFDVGIAEGHAVTMAAGMAKQGLLPVFAVYSTFLQRSYDMLIHDVAIEGLHAVFCVDRAGLVGEDGETHHGLFDVAYLGSIPGMTVLAPASLAELRSMLRMALRKMDGPVALRYPRGTEGDYREDRSEAPAVSLRSGSELTLVCYGSTVDPVLETADNLKQLGISAEVIKLNRIVPVDTALLSQSAKKTGKLMVVEEVAAMGCVGERILSELSQRGLQLKKSLLCNCGTGFVTHGSPMQLRELCGLDAASLTRRAREVCQP